MAATPSNLSHKIGQQTVLQIFDVVIHKTGLKRQQTP